jgi:hypothetical protein
MTVTVASNTTENVEYTVTIEHAQAVRCTCIAQFYHPERACRHMRAKQADIQAEIARAARFLAVKLQVQGMQETWKCQYEMAFDSRF